MNCIMAVKGVTIYIHDKLIWHNDQSHMTALNVYSISLQQLNCNIVTQQTIDHLHSFVMGVHLRYFLTTIAVLLPTFVECQQQLPPYTLHNTRPVLKLPRQGGTARGSPFDDLEKIGTELVFKVHSLEIGVSSKLDSIQVTYVLSNRSLYKAPLRGHPLSSPRTITLAPDEYLEKLEGWTDGRHINQLIITTYTPAGKERRAYGPYGSLKSSDTPQRLVLEGHILGIHGSVRKDTLNSIGTYVLAPLKRSQIFGYNGLLDFAEDPDEIFPPALKISKLFVHHGDQIDALWAEYQLLGGGRREGQKRGGDSGTLTTVEFASDEHLIGLQGKTDSSPFGILTQITFLTINQRKEIKFYGPFGKTSEHPFYFYDNIVSITGGQFQSMIEGVQMYTVANDTTVQSQDVSAVVSPTPARTDQALAPNPFLTSRPILKLPRQGKLTGVPFDDLQDSRKPGVLKVHSIEIGSSFRLDSIQVTYLLSDGSLYKAPRHGKGLFETDTITLAADEYLETLEGKTNGKYINELVITTFLTGEKTRRVYGPYGMERQNVAQNFVLEGHMIAIHGSAKGALLNSIGAYVLAPVEASQVIGSVSYGIDFTDDPDQEFPPVVGMGGLSVWHGEQIDALQAEYRLLGGGTREGDKHGVDSGNLTKIVFAPDEVVSGVLGKTYKSSDHPTRFLSQLTILTTSGKGKVRTYGPFGTKDGDSFKFDRSVLSLAGVYRDVVNGIKFFSVVQDCVDLFPWYHPTTNQAM